jgi:hypothetical protein
MFEVAAHEVFDVMPRWDDDTIRVQQIAFEASMVSTTPAHELFDENPLAKVIWDEESHHGFDPYGLEQQCKLTVFEAPMMSKSDTHKVFDPLSSQIVWDDELLQSYESHDSLLKLMAHGECMVGEATMHAEPYDIVVWDERRPHNFVSHQGLLQQLANGEEYMTDEKTHNIVELATTVGSTHARDSPLFLDLAMDITDRVLVVDPNSDTREGTTYEPEQLYHESQVRNSEQKAIHMCLPSWTGGLRPWRTVTHQVLEDMSVGRQINFSCGSNEHLYKLYCDFPCCSFTRSNFHVTNGQKQQQQGGNLMEITSLSDEVLGSLCLANKDYGRQFDRDHMVLFLTRHGPSDSHELNQDGEIFIVVGKLPPWSVACQMLDGLLSWRHHPLSLGIFGKYVGKLNYSSIGRSEVSKIQIQNYPKLYLALFGHEILHIQISVNSVMEQLLILQIFTTQCLFENFVASPCFSSFDLGVQTYSHLALQYYSRVGHTIVSVKGLQVPWDPGGLSCKLHTKLQKRQLEDKLNFQGAVMSYTYALGLYCRWASLLHMFFYVRLTCGANFWGKRKATKGDHAVEEGGTENQKRVSFSLSSSRRHGPGDLLDRLTSRSSPPAATGRDTGIGWVGGWVWRNPVHDPIRGVGEVRWGADGRSSRRLVASSREQDGTGRDPAELEQVLGAAAVCR